MDKEKVYSLINSIPKGKVTTYKSLASALNTKAYRYIGQICKNNLNLISTPCHRVVGSSGKLTGYVNGIKKKKQLLESEGIEIKNNSLNLQKYFFKV